jgi:hypothetical protein
LLAQLIRSEKLGSYFNHENGVQMDSRRVYMRATSIDNPAIRTICALGIPEAQDSCIEGDDTLIREPALLIGVSLGSRPGLLLCRLLDAIK